MYQISTDKLAALFGKMAASKAVYMPIRKNGQVNFSKWSEGEEYCSDELKTVKSAKDLFFPQSENIVAFKKEGKKISIETGELPADMQQSKRSAAAVISRATPRRLRR